MSTGVFGTPITSETVRQLPEYNQTRVTQWDRARVALFHKNAEDKHIIARKFARELRQDYKDRIGTECLIYNATGDRVQLAAYWDFSGKLAMSAYPIIIENGQWGVFLHGRFEQGASTATVVYEGKNAEGNLCQWVLAWRHTNVITNPNVCYTDIRNSSEKRFTLQTTKSEWEAEFEGRIINPKEAVNLSISNDTGSKAFASISDTHVNTPAGIFEAILTVADYNGKEPTPL